MLKIENAVFGYKTKLFEIDSITLQSGRFVALIGANGTGKSTLLNTLSTGKISIGKIHFNRVDFVAIKAEERAKYVSLIDNRFAGFDHLNTKEYLELGRFPYTGFSGRLSKEDNQVVEKYVELLCLEHLLDQSTSTLSDGERQRAGIARAFIQETPLLLMDEPTSFLDYPTKLSIMRTVQELAKNEGKLVIMASHDLELCLNYCTDILLIDPKENVLKAFSAEISLADLLKEAF